MGVVLASKGYPGHYQKGFSIEGLDKVDAQVYHMGTALSEGRYLTNGGRVLMVVGSGPGLAQASKKVYEQVRKIECDNLFYRNDIAHIGLLWDK